VHFWSRIGLLLVAGLILAACGDSNTAANVSANKLKVAATTTQVGDFVKNVGGNRIDLTTIIKPNTNAHDYEPTADDSKALAASQLIFSNGIGLDQWLDKLIQNSGTKAKQVTVTEGIKPRPGNNSEEKEGDPHVWFNIDNAKQMVDNIAKGFADVDPTNAATYKANATSYKEQLDKLDSEIKAQIATIPEVDRKFVSNHDAFSYYLNRYGIKFVGSVIPSFDSTAEPSAKDLADLLAKIKSEKVKAIFTESSLNPKLEKQIADQAGVKIYANLYGDSLGPSGSEADTYLKMMSYNTKTIVAGLSGK
jgi:zinc/manganese transport system substrate-binding protein/manganese/iron transport system substrate-binding protein